MHGASWSHIVRRCAHTVIAPLAIVVVFTAIAHAGAGALDPTFNTTGKVRTSFTDNDVPANFFADGTAIAIDGQGRILVAGAVASPACTTTPACPYAIAFARYKTDGSLDTTFGNSGKYVYYVASHSFYPAAITFDSQQRILVTGTWNYEGDSNADFFVMRMYANGGYDSSFGPLFGYNHFDFDGDVDRAWAIAVQSDGKILLAGGARVGGDYDFGLIRLNSDATLDTTFSGGGMVNTGFGNDDVAFGMAIDSQGRIVLAGSSGSSIIGRDSSLPNPPRNGNVALARYNTDGSLDSGFGSGGRVTTVVTHLSPSLAEAMSVDLDALGRIVVGGFIQYDTYSTSPFQMLVARYLDDGSLDNLFGSGGKLLGADGAIYALTHDSKGRIAAAGFKFVGPNYFDYAYAVARFTSDGNPDATFGSNGLTTTDFGSGHGEARALAIDSQDRLVVTGSDRTSSIATARYIADATADLYPTISASVSAAIPGDTVTYYVSANNSGPDVAHNAALTDVLPASLSPVACSAASGSCNTVGNTVTINFPVVNSFPSFTGSIVTTVSPNVADGTVISNTVTLAASDPADPNSANNSATSSIVVHNKADVKVTAKASSTSVKAGANLTYTLTLTNSGPYTATGVTLTDAVPGNTTFVSLTGQPCSTPIAGGTGTISCVLASLASGSSATVQFTVKVSGSTNKTSVTNTANVSTATFDPITANNAAVTITQIYGNKK